MYLLKTEDALSIFYFYDGKINMAESQRLYRKYR